MVGFNKARRDRIPELIDSRALGGSPFLVVAPEAPSYTPQTNSIDLDGSTEYFGNQTSVTVGHGASWSIMLWFNKASDFTADASFYQYSGTGSGNKIYLNHSSSAQGRLDVTVVAANGTDQHFIRNDSFFSSGSGWHQMLIVHTDSTTTMYRDDTSIANDTVPATVAMTDADTRGHYQTGTKFLGRWHSMAMWNVALDANNRTAIYNSGDGTLNLGEDAGNYDQSAALVHWWRFGHDDSADSNLALDSGFGSTPIDLMINAANITTADVVVDAP